MTDYSNIPYTTHRYRVVSVLNQLGHAQRVRAVETTHQTQRTFFSNEDFRPFVGKEVAITTQGYIVKAVGA
jgi:hypothetical protein